MASFAEMNPAPVLRLDRDGTILLVNPAARQLFGETDLLGESWYALCPELEPIALELLGEPDLLVKSSYALRPGSESSALERSLQGADTLWHEAQIGERCLLFTYYASLERGQVYVFGADITERKASGGGSARERNHASPERKDGRTGHAHRRRGPRA